MTLDDLYAEYKTREHTGRRAFNTLVKRFQEGRNTTFAEAAACSAAVMGLHIDAGFDPSGLTPELQESFRLAFPNLNIEDVGNYSGEHLEGLLQPWKGKLFEVSVRDRLNNGEWVGEFHLDPGQQAELAESATQPGWDMQILNADGSVADLVQLKATNYVAYVESALDRYPEYDVLATSELVSHQGTVAGLSVSDLSDAQLESQLSDAVSSDDFGLLGLGLPLIPLALNIFWVAKGSRTVSEAATSVALSAGAIAGGDLLGDLATDMIGDAVIDGIGSVILDGIFGFGLFTLGRWLLGSSDRKEKQQARDRAEQLRIEHLAIDSTCRHIDERFESATKALDRMGNYYLPGPTVA
ncbi:MAG: hypothetical protein PHV02_00095 [Rhodocyclaceae bacterium]|nr:hypothetical protein [Rhodocyclaceae bacterium]